jgi:hypothetical protein
MENFTASVAATIICREHDARINANAHRWARNYDGLPAVPDEIPMSRKEMLQRIQITAEHSCELDTISDFVIEEYEKYKAKLVALINKLDDEFTQFKERFTQDSPEYTFDSSSEILSITEIYEHLKHDRKFTPDELNILLDEPEILGGVWYEWQRLDTIQKLIKKQDECFDNYIERIKASKTTTEKNKAAEQKKTSAFDSEMEGKNGE